MTTMNNVSKLKFKEFLSKTGLEKVKGNRQIVSINGEKWQFSLSTGDKLECRQLYEDCKGFISLHLPTNDLRVCRVFKPRNYKWSRATKDGVNAYSVERDLENSLSWREVCSG